MKKVLKYIIIILIIAAIIVGGVVLYRGNSKTEKAETTYSESTAIKTDIVNTLASSSYVQTALSEKKQLHNTYYFGSLLVELNQKVSADENIIEYTNGTYLTAPYDCVVTEASLPNSGEVCTSSHYITIESTNSLLISTTVSEDELSKVSVGQEAQITVNALNSKEYTGYITSVSNTADYSSSGSKFDVVVEFENDGEVLLGMKAKCEIVLEKATDCIAIPKEAVTTKNDKSIVYVKDANGKTSTVSVETGISNNAYIEIKSGINEGDTILIEKNSSNSSRNSFSPGDMGGMNFPKGDFSKGGSQGGSSNRPQRPGN